MHPLFLRAHTFPWTLLGAGIDEKSSVDSLHAASLPDAVSCRRKGYGGQRESTGDGKQK
jgi:hypothetical protein